MIKKNKFHYFLRSTMLKNNSYDTISHEYLEYYSLTSLEYILNKAKLKIIDISLNSINGGSFFNNCL